MKTSKKDYKIFKIAVLQWMKYFNLKDWDVFFLHSNLDSPLAKSRYNINSRQITFTLSKTWPKWMYNKEQLYKTAYHEVIESALIGKLILLAINRYVSEDEIIAAGHEIVMTLQNTVFEDMWDKVKKIDVKKEISSNY